MCKFIIYACKGTQRGYSTLFSYGLGQGFAIYLGTYIYNIYMYVQFVNKTLYKALVGHLWFLSKLDNQKMSRISLYAI